MPLAPVDDTREGPARDSALNRTASPLLASLVLVAGLTLLVLWPAYERAGRVLIYALDDTYIHLAVAKSLVTSGVWGLNPGEFAGPSSSPLWVLILAATSGAGGPADAAPLLLNTAVAALLVVSLWAMLRHTFDGGRLVVAVVGVAMAACLPSLLAVGMENALHALLAVWVLWLAGRVAAGAGGGDRRRAVALALLTALMVACRFEGMFMAAAVAVVLAGRRRWAAAAAVVVAAAVPVAAYAAFSLAHGGGWLPNSVLLKSRVAHVARFAGAWWEPLARPAFKALNVPHLYALAAAAGLLLTAAWRDASAAAARARAVLAVFLLSAAAHVLSVPTGQLFRYEAYIMVVGWVAVIGAVAGGPRLGARPEEPRPSGSGGTGRAVRLDPALPTPSLPDGRGSSPAEHGAVAAATGGSAPTPRSRLRNLARLGTAIAALLFACKFAFATYRTLSAPRDIGRQQIQTARLLNAALPGMAVAANDIGAVAYYGRGYVLDLWGLSDNEVCRLRLAGRYDAAAIDRLCRDRGVRVAAVYEGWFAPPPLAVPSAWVPLERWEVDAAYILGERTVTVFATDAAHAADLRAALAAYQPALPAGVTRTRVEPGGR